MDLRRLRYSVVPASLRNFRRKGVVYKTVRSLSPTVEMGVVWRRADSSAVLQAFLEIVKEFARSQGHTEDDRRASVLRASGANS